MYLKAIELENFKSFVHKNRIEFKPGFTAISGPNGSGKSNIGDAILFVLGPKSSKVIRANKLTDLIYDGGKKGKPADYCRVSLIFDNSDRVLPIDSNEVKLTRYVKRANNEQGYNSYFYINDEPARLQDFISLLEHAKISADGYNFVKQGDVTRIVEMSPVERRQILDEISGIAEFDKSIEKAKEKKRSVEENMEKIEVLLDEIKKRLEVLEGDRRIALRYKELEEKLKETKAKIAYSKMGRARKDMETYERHLEEIEGEIEKIREKISEEEKEIEKLRVKKEEVERKIEESGGEDLRKMRERIDEIKIEMARIKTRIENRVEKIAESRERIKKLREELKSIRKKMRGVEGRVEEKRKEMLTKSGELDEKKRILEKKELEVRDANERYREISDEVERLNREIEGKRKLYNDKLVEYNTANERQRSIEREIAELEEEKKDLEEGIRDAEWRIKEAKEKGKSTEKRRKKLNEEYLALRNRRTQIEKALKDKQREIDEIKAKYERLRGRMESGDSLSLAVNAVLAARDRGELKGIYGTIAELGSVDEKYELAIQIAAGNRMMSIVCEDDESAARAIEYLKRNRLGRAIFLPLNKMLSGRPRGRALLASRDPKSHGFAIDLIEFDRKFEPAFWYVFGDTVVVEDLDTARKLMGGVRLVTLDGQLIEASGAMVGGSVEKRKSISMGNLRDLSEKLRALMAEKEDLEVELKSIEARIEEILKEINAVGNVDTKEIELWSNEKNRLEGKLATVLKKIKDLNAQRENLEKVISSLKDEMDRVGKEIESLESRRDSLRDEMENLIPEKYMEEISALRDEISTLQSEVSALREEIIKMEGDLKGMRNREESILSTINELEGNVKDLISSNENERRELENLTLERKKYEEIVSKEEARIREMMDELSKITDDMAKREREIEKMKGDIRVKEEMKISLTTRHHEASQRYEETRREYESYGIKVEKVESVSKLQESLMDLEAQLSSLGDVNLKSIEDYEIEMERYNNLKDDYNSLAKEKKEIEELMKELNEKKKVTLVKVFDAINENFRRIYREMSNGGEAFLVLENPEDPFKGGLVMKVKPPGKGLKHLHSLSGGEKSLTALAFIFAIQQYDPSPIYLLDEVDMFLDGVNSEILGRIIKRNSRSAQFIVVSLRKATIKFADHIIGVTNRGDGISRIYMQNVPGEVSENE